VAFDGTTAAVNRTIDLAVPLDASYFVVILKHDPEKWIPVFGKDHAPARR
jgi:hypothetical protein